ncbi:hypothetical protein HDU97_001271 [Phlyctochytrium planicorne]|nr:hypothetical protein HDU97_001271 [Phlyctochytrium planicorne]
MSSPAPPQAVSAAIPPKDPKDLGTTDHNTNLTTLPSSLYVLLLKLLTSLHHLLLAFHTRLSSLTLPLLTPIRTTLHIVRSESSAILATRASSTLQPAWTHVAAVVKPDVVGRGRRFWWPFGVGIGRGGGVEETKEEERKRVVGDKVTVDMILEDVADLACWSLASGASHLSVYDRYGILKQNKTELSSKLHARFQDFASNNLPSFIEPIPSPAPECAGQVSKQLIEKASPSEKGIQKTETQTEKAKNIITVFEINGHEGQPAIPISYPIPASSVPSIQQPTSPLSAATTVLSSTLSPSIASGVLKRPPSSLSVASAAQGQEEDDWEVIPPSSSLAPGQESPMLRNRKSTSSLVARNKSSTSLSKAVAASSLAESQVEKVVDNEGEEYFVMALKELGSEKRMLRIHLLDGEDGKGALARAAVALSASAVNDDKAAADAKKPTPKITVKTLDGILNREGEFFVVLLARVCIHYLDFVELRVSVFVDQSWIAG